MCAPETSIRKVTRVCLDTPAARPAPSFVLNGVFALQDTDVEWHLAGREAQQVYTVRFAARELWGSQASPRDSVYVDLWEDYLERA